MITRNNAKDRRNDAKILHKELSYQLQGCIFDIRREYGSGHKEMVYKNLLADYLRDKGVQVEVEKSISVRSNRSAKIVGSYRPDLIVDNKIIVEIKASRYSIQQDEKQLYYYLKNSEYEVGYLVNFGTSSLYMKRMVYSNERKGIFA